MTLIQRIRHRVTRRRLYPPIGFVHIPKASGTALVQQLEARLRPHRYVYGLDRSQFGSFGAFETIPPSMRATIFLNPDEIPANADIIAGHLSPQTIRARYPDANLITILRAPASRLLSHWFYWRSYSDDVLAQYGRWGDIIVSARLNLSDFLQIHALACVTDNVALRMLLWPHPLIPSDDFIDPANDATLLRDALRVLESFAYVTIMESANANDELKTWLRQTYGVSIWPYVQEFLQKPRVINRNTSKAPPFAMKDPLRKQLATGAESLLRHNCRLDDIIWHGLAKRIFSAAESKNTYENQLIKNIERYEQLSSS